MIERKHFKQIKLYPSFLFHFCPSRTYEFLTIFIYYRINIFNFIIPSLLPLKKVMFKLFFFIFLDHLRIDNGFEIFTNSLAREMQENHGLSLLNEIKGLLCL